MASAFVASELGVLFGLVAILILRVVAEVLNEIEHKAAMERFKQELRDHPPSTATNIRLVLSATLKELPPHD